MGIIRTAPVIVGSLLVSAVAVAQPPPGPPPGPPPPPPPGGGGGPGYYAAPTGPMRNGFTIGLDVGFGFTHIAADGFDSESEPGFSGINLSLGGYLNPRLAILFRLSDTAFNYFDVTFVNAFVGVQAQYYVAPNFFIGGGVGAAIFAAPFEDDCIGDCSDEGFAINARGGFEVWQSSTSAIHLALELSPSFYDDYRVTSVGLQVGWQHF